MPFQQRNGRMWSSTVYSLQPVHLHFVRYCSQGQTLRSCVKHRWEGHAHSFLLHSIMQSSTLSTRLHTRVFEQSSKSSPPATYGHASTLTGDVGSGHVFNANTARSKVILSNHEGAFQDKIGILTGSMWLLYGHTTIKWTPLFPDLCWPLYPLARGHTDS